MKTILITNDPNIASDAVSAGVCRIMVDIESIGKKERQASRNTFISTHQISDIKNIRKVLKNGELIVRINPFYSGTEQEIQQVIEAGAERIMLPMILSMNDFYKTIEIVSGRVKILPLVETAYSMAHIDDISSSSAIDEIYIGLNDLHLSLGLDFLFEPLALGLLDWMVEIIKSHKKPFGFGGIATIGSGELPAERILAEHIRLESSCVILSSRFCKDIDIENQDGREDRIRNSLQIMHKKWLELSKRNNLQVENDKKETAKIIQELAKKLYDSRKLSLLY